MTLQSSAEPHLLNELFSASYVVWPVFPLCNFEFVNFCLYNVRALQVAVPISLFISTAQVDSTVPRPQFVS
jgi:hypothetical protein